MLTFPPKHPIPSLQTPLTPYAYTTPIYNASPSGVTLANPDGLEPPMLPGAYGKAMLRSWRHIPSHLIGKTNEARDGTLAQPPKAQGTLELVFLLSPCQTLGLAELRPTSFAPAALHLPWATPISLTQKWGSEWQRVSHQLPRLSPQGPSGPPDPHLISAGRGFHAHQPVLIWRLGASVFLPTKWVVGPHGSAPPPSHQRSNQCSPGLGAA